MVSLRKLSLLSTTALVGLDSARARFPRSNDDPDLNTGRYIVILRDGLEASAVEQHMHWATSLRARDTSPTIELGMRWNIGSWNAYSCTMDGNTLAQINGSDAVKLVEPDSRIDLFRHITQENASWGLGSISHRGRVNRTDYVYDSRAGEGTYAYILDTGLLATHEEFEGRASLGYNAVGGRFVDEVGHGTHVAGTLGGKTYGVAKKAKIISVKIFAGYRSSVSNLLQGFEWAVGNITGENRQKNSVISISAGGEAREAVNQAVNEAYNQGILTVVAAGNADQDAQHFSPASAENAITVGSVGRNDSRSIFSNWGQLVDIFAPGESIESAWIGDNQDTRNLSGTSMSTPHISGLLLYLKSIIPYRMETPVDSLKELQQLATHGVVRDIRGSKNLLGFNGNGETVLANGRAPVIYNLDHTASN
ncbi:oryzin precursor [Annulohypoxylon maeteangense]|uniref:oryzin precursor n=1 Tax=Annulohypoxylon maeteangense TaxID=1927788 RepID=UPI002007CB5E|nr:oryzin precursor [Annulohypoxylon maeteangense]KAI0880195.1 oryzin precursor [Annulohypoxylon maeteangense]